MRNISKYSLGKLNLEGILPHQLPELAKETGFDLIGLSPQKAATYHQLEAKWHRNPFDRMLIWQAIQNNFTVISNESHFENYKSVGLKVIW